MSIERLKKLKRKIFKDYSTDIALRYFPVIDIMRKDKLLDSNVLEVGSGDMGITQYLDKAITGVDIEFGEKNNNLLKKIKIDGMHFPFADNEFDLAISIDNLEHVPMENKGPFLNEMIRVAGKNIIIVVPCGRSAWFQDKKLDNYFYKKNNRKDKFLNEHVLNGLPEINEVLSMIDTACRLNNKHYHVECIKKLTNLKIREIIMKLKISNNPFFNILYYSMLVFLPLRNLMNFGTCYRQLIYLKILE